MLGKNQDTVQHNKSVRHLFSKSLPSMFCLKVSIEVKALPQRFPFEQLAQSLCVVECRKLIVVNVRKTFGMNNFRGQINDLRTERVHIDLRSRIISSSQRIRFTVLQFSFGLSVFTFSIVLTTVSTDQANVFFSEWFLSIPPSP